MKKQLLTSILILLFSAKIFAQACTVTASIPQDTIVCGESILLTAFGQGPGIPVLTEDFGTGSFGPGWSATPQVMFNNPCGPNTIDGSTYIWMGNSSPVPRILTTAPFNLSNCTNAGVTICFDLHLAEQDNSAPCEGPDEPDEGVYIQYSTNGTTWTDIHYFDPVGGHEPQLVNWNNWCFPVPLAALTSSTQFRWFQDNDSGADFDHWGLDNIVIYCNDSTFSTIWQHDGYNLGPTGGTNPTPVAPRTTTSYVVTMGNGATSCSDTITVVVRNPTIVVDAGTDTSVCTGQCAVLNATAKIIQKPAKTPTYRNQETANISGTPGFPGFPPFIPATPGSAFLNMDINITNLNLSTVQNGYITSVCVGSLDMILFSGVEIFDIWLVCPSGDSILLVKDSTLVGTTLTNTCFVPAGSNITSSSAPYTGNFSPNQSFNNLTGCNANGLWSLRFNAVYNGITLPTGVFNSWSISFNDPEISYTGNFDWNPTTGMTNPLTLSPTVCPPPNQYVLTVSDTAGCVTQNDTVNVSVQACCGLSANATSTSPTCGASDGTISITPVPAGSYTFAWDNGSSQQNQTGLAPGTYCVTITDNNIPGCTFDTCITINSINGPTVSFSNQTNPTCAGGDGSITVNLAGGTAPYNVTVDTGGTPINVTLPFPISTPVPNLSVGTVDVTVTDAQGCIATATATLIAPTNCCTFIVNDLPTQPGCAQTNGSIALTASNGSGNYSFAWAGGATTSSITGVGAGAYDVTITDNAYANCFIDTTYVLSNPNAPIIDNVVITPESCTGNDGTVSVTASGGTPPLTILWSNSATSFSITNLVAGTYNFTVSDASSCEAAGTSTVNPATGCCFLETSASVIPPSCGLNNASITIAIITAGTPAYTYSMDGASAQSQNIFSNVPSGQHSIITFDVNLCSDTLQVTVPPSSNNLFVSITKADITCSGANDGTAAAHLAGGNPPYSYIWNTTSILDSLSNLAAGVYSVSVTDQTGCSGSATTTIADPPLFSVTLNTIDAVCFDAPDGSIDAMVSGGTPGYSYLWSDNSVNQTAAGLLAGSYSVTVTDNSGCTVSSSSTVSEPAELFFTTDAIQVRCPGEQSGAITISSSTGGNPPYTYAATLDGANFVFATNDTLMNLISDTYTVIFSDDNGCTLSQDVFVPGPVDDNFIHSEKPTSCVGSQYSDGSVEISGTTGQNMPYVFGIDGGVIDNAGLFDQLTAGSHVVTAQNKWGCLSQIIVIVPSPVGGVAEVYPGDTIIQLGESLQLTSSFSSFNSDSVSYLWSPAHGLSCVDCPNPVVTTYDGSTHYMLIVTYGAGCTATADINVTVQSKPEFYIPNSFSPNGDGNNDKWMVHGKGMKSMDLKIFNRWGEKIYETNNILDSWDGTYKGVLQNPAVFVYHVDVTFLDDKKESRIGSIMLIR